MAKKAIDKSKNKVPLSFFKVAVEHMVEGLWVGDKDNKTSYVNPAFEKIFGYTEADWQGKHSYDYFDEKNREVIKKQNEGRKKGQSSRYEVEVLTKNGESIPVLMSGAPTPNGGTVGIMTDLRFLKHLEKSEQEFKNFAKFSVDAMVCMDTEGRIQEWNVGAARMFGWKAKEVVEKNIRVLSASKEKDEYEQLMKEATEKGFVRNHETLRVHKNSSPIEVSLTLTALTDKNGELWGYSAVYRDITTQKQWEKDLQDRYQKLHEAYVEMGKMRRYMDYLEDTLELAVDKPATTNIPRYITTAVLMFSWADAVVLRRYDEKKQQLVLQATAGSTLEWETKGNIPYKGSLGEQCLKKKQALKILDVTHDGLYKTPGFARKNNLRSLLLLPLYVQEKKIGTLSVYISPEKNMDILDHEFLPIFAKQASLILSTLQVS